MVSRRSQLTIIAVAIIGFFLIRYALEERWSLFFNDVGFSLVGILFFNLFFKKLNQDNLSYAAFLTILILHITHLYSYTFILPWDVYMHFVAGIALGIMVHRLFRGEGWSASKAALVIFFFVMGVSAIHEMIEWTGYAILGEGEGWLLFGAGDEGGWQDTIHDLAMNALGTILFLLAQHSFKHGVLARITRWVGSTR